MVKEGFMEEVLLSELLYQFGLQPLGKWHAHECHGQGLALGSRLGPASWKDRWLEVKKTRGLGQGQGAEPGPCGDAQESPALCHPSYD